jgi:hypothetical protein
MTNITLDLPEEVHRALKELDISASDLLVDAARAEIRRRALLEETDCYLTELAESVGEPSPEGLARAQVLALRVLAGDTSGTPR